jgi:hypothetical protein
MRGKTSRKRISRLRSLLKVLLGFASTRVQTHPSEVSSHIAQSAGRWLQVTSVSVRIGEPHNDCDACWRQRHVRECGRTACYLLWWVTGLIFYLIDKRPFVRSHATQSSGSVRRPVHHSPRAGNVVHYWHGFSHGRRRISFVVDHKSCAVDTAHDQG